MKHYRENPVKYNGLIKKLLIEERSEKMSPAEGRKWRKSDSNRIIAGVCGGLAEYFKIDATVVRILWLVSIFLNGLGLLAYLVALVVLPAASDDPASREGGRKSGSGGWLILGVLLILLGLFWGVHNWGWYAGFPCPGFTHWGRQDFWPVLLVVLGILYLVHVLKDSKAGGGSGGSSGSTNTSRWPFHRTTDDRVIGGVCGGLARHVRIDPTLVRIGTVVFVLMTGVVFGVLLYAAALVLIPEEKKA